jgi:hypothetical protein
MATSKSRPRWSELPAEVRAQVQELLEGRVVSAQSCSGGFSPGFASRLVLADGRRAFVKAMDAEAWPMEAEFHRAEARTAAVLPLTVAAPTLLGSVDDGAWVILAFADVDGIEPRQPWRVDELVRVAEAIVDLSATTLPPSIRSSLPRGHPRLGGWAELSESPPLVDALSSYSTWAAARLAALVELEREGLEAARGSSLVHFDLYAHNIVLAGDRVLFVDWPHARLGAPCIDLVLCLSSAVSGTVDVDEVLLDVRSAAASTSATSPRCWLRTPASVCWAASVHRIRGSSR